MIYAIHKETKKHRLIGSVAMAENEWELVQADADGWIPWEGGECPLPDGEIMEAICIDGSIWGPARAGDFLWDCHWFIRSYRPIPDAEPSEPEAPEWPQPGDKAELHNEPGYAVAYGDSAIGGEVKVLAVFYSDAIKMAAVEHDGSCYCFRAEMLRPIRSEEDRLVEQALKDISAEPDEYGADSVVYRMIKAGYRKAGGDT